MTLPQLTTQQLGAWIARIGSAILIVLSAIPKDAIPTNARPYLAIAGAIILAVDRYVTDPTTGNTTPTTTEPANVTVHVPQPLVHLVQDSAPKDTTIPVETTPEPTPEQAAATAKQRMQQALAR